MLIFSKDYLMRFIALSLVLLLAPTAAQAATPVSGRWITQDGKAIVTIGKCGATLCGRISKLLVEPPKDMTVDTHNPDPKLRDRPILGLPVLIGFEDRGSDYAGHVYSPEEGKTYRAFMHRDGEGTLKVKGCVAFFCKTQTWKAAR